MSNPPLVEVWRDGLIESVHRGSYAVMDSEGQVLAAAGDIDRPMFPRSAYKIFQSLDLIESGAADGAALTDAELAIAAASHWGADLHVGTVRAWLKRLRLPEAALACGAQEPLDPAELARLHRRRRKPTQLHNNCSGKHAGFLTLARHLDLSLWGYTEAGHPLQKRITATIADLCDQDPHALAVAVDGCSAPNLGMPLRAFGLGVARCAARRGVSAGRAQALERQFAAQAAHPVMLSGLGGLDTALIAAGKGRFVTKTGAEGVYSAFMVELGLGVVLKIDDGATRAAQSAICEILVRLGVLDPACAGIQSAHRPVLRNWRGLDTGRMRPVSDAFAALSAP
ncbi:MAG: asparaginase [Alphaproteobacteria bacterium]